MRIFKFFLLAVLAIMVKNGYGQASKMETLSLHKFIKGQQDMEVVVDFRYANGSESLERYCSKLFYKDSVSNSLEEATQSYLAQLGKEMNSLNAEYKSILKLKMLDKFAHCQNYTAEYEMVNLTEDKTIHHLVFFFIYDTLHHRVLKIQDILKPEYFKQVKEPCVGFSVSPTGLAWVRNMGLRQVSHEVIEFMNSPKWFTKEFNELVGIDSIVAPMMDRVNAEISQKIIDYQRSDKRPYKEIHLFMMHNRIFVTGLYKEIDSLTVDDIRLLKKKNKYILYDIYIAKKFQRGDLPIVDNDDLDLKSRFRMNGYISIDEYMKDHLNKRRFDGFETSVVFFIEDDGTLVCPIVVKGKNIEENKEIIRVLRKTVSEWLPAQKEGKNVLTMRGYSFDYVVRTVINFERPIFR